MGNTNSVEATGSCIIKFNMERESFQIRFTKIVSKHFVDTLLPLVGIFLLSVPLADLFLLLFLVTLYCSRILLQPFIVLSLSTALLLAAFLTLF